MLFRLIAAFTSALTITACASAPRPAAPPAPQPSRAPVSLTYLGVAGWQMTDGAHALLFDPYFTRVRVEDPHAAIAPDEGVIAKYAPAHADGILVSHSHYDHLLDVPSIAKRTGAMVVGTESTLNVARASGVAESRLALAQGSETFAIGPFAVQAVRALHSLTGQPFATIARGVALPMPAEAWGEGGTLQYVVRTEGRTLLFIGTANFVESELQGLHPDVVIMAVGLREKIPDYSCRLMRVLGRPPLVLTNHFDAHWEPLGPKQMDIEDGASLTRFADEIHACAPDTKVVVPTHFVPIAI